jgi:hypothetical protein
LLLIIVPLVCIMYYVVIVNSFCCWHPERIVMFVPYFADTSYIGMLYREFIKISMMFPC